MPRPWADHLGAPIPNASRLTQPAWLTRAGSGRAGTRRAAGRWRAGRCFLLLDKTVSDGLSGGQGPAAARVLADLVHLAAGHVGQPEVQRVEHAGHPLLAGADRGHRAAEMQPGLGEHEDGVRVPGPIRAGGEYTDGRPADLTAHAGVYRHSQYVENAHDGEGGGQFGPYVLQLQPDRVLLLSVQREELRGEPGRHVVVEHTRDHNDSLG